MDYYGRRLATCSSDKTIRIFEVEGESSKLLQVLKGHEGPVWQVSWAHPKFGNLLASCSYDGRVLIWKETNNTWAIFKEHRAHEASVNSISWAPHEYGLMLACASSDGKVSILQQKVDGQWESQHIDAHQIGCNAVSWAPAITPSLSATASTPPVLLKRFATAGCDNLIKIWRYKEEEGLWKEEKSLQGHSDWVRDVAWAQTIGIPSSTIASCSQDRQVFIWTQDGDNAEWNHVALKNEKFPDVVWRVSWSVTGTILAVSCGDNKVYLYKESLEGQWECLSELQENDAATQNQGTR